MAENTKKAPKCWKCQKPTQLLCKGCKKPICSIHGHVIRRSAYCSQCFEKHRKVGLMKSWGAVLILGAVAILLWVFL